MGGGKGGSAPTPPDPYATANAALGYSEGTAAYNAGLNRYDVTTPYGSQSWSMVGGSPSGGGIPGGSNTPTGGKFGGGYGLGGMFGNTLSNVMNGKGGGIPGGSTASYGGAPHYQETISLSPAQQQILDNQNAQAISLTGGAENGLVNQINQNSQQGMPDWATSRQQAQDALYKNQTQYLDPQFQQQGEQLQSQLANQGVVPGTEAYDNAMKNFNLAKQSAYSNATNSAISGATNQQGQNIQNWSAINNQPVNEYNALKTGNAVQTPNFQQPGATNAQSPDFMGAVNNNYMGQLAAYNAQTGAGNATTGGLFSLGSSIAGQLPWSSWFSDGRLKHDIKRVGTTKGGLPVYSFKYLGSDEPQVGVLAQEVLEAQPTAISQDKSGYLKVDYSRVQ